MKKAKLILRIIVAIVCFIPSIPIIYIDRGWFIAMPFLLITIPFMRFSEWLQNKEPYFVFSEVLKHSYYVYAEPIYFWLHYIKNEKYDFNSEYSKHF